VTGPWQPMLAMPAPADTDPAAGPLALRNSTNTANTNIDRLEASLNDVVTRAAALTRVTATPLFTPNTGVSLRAAYAYKSATVVHATLWVTVSVALTPGYLLGSWHYEVPGPSVAHSVPCAFRETGGSYMDLCSVDIGGTTVTAAAGSPGQRASSYRPGPTTTWGAPLGPGYQFSSGDIALQATWTRH
jgi:hypothetical protein